MSSQIFYKKAFIKVDDKFIPLVNQGASNCSSFNFEGREVADMYWSVLRYPFNDRLIFTEDEIREIARRHEECNTSNRGGTRKSHNTAFEVGEFERWILAGMKSAYTVEEYTHFGNTVQIVDSVARKRTTVKTTQELLDAIRVAKGGTIDVTFGNSREVRRPLRSNTPKKLDEFDAMNEYFVLKNGAGYFTSLTCDGARVCPRFAKSLVRKFKSEKAALNYLRRYSSRLEYLNFEVTRIRKGYDV